MISTRCQYSAVTSISGFSSSGSLSRYPSRASRDHQDNADGEVDRMHARDEPVKSEKQLRAGFAQGEMPRRAPDACRCLPCTQRPLPP